MIYRASTGRVSNVLAASIWYAPGVPYSTADAYRTYAPLNAACGGVLVFTSFRRDVGRGNAPDFVDQLGDFHRIMFLRQFESERLNKQDFMHPSISLNEFS